MAVVTKEDEALEALRERMRGARSGEVEVLDVRTERDWYPQLPDIDEFVRVTLKLSDPGLGRPTWPGNSVDELIRRSYLTADELEIESDVVVTYRSREDWEPDGGGR
jgi:hypothetical protein